MCFTSVISVDFPIAGCTHTMCYTSMISAWRGFLWTQPQKTSFPIEFPDSAPLTEYVKSCIGEIKVEKVYRFKKLLIFLSRHCATPRKWENHFSKDISTKFCSKYQIINRNTKLTQTFEIFILWDFTGKLVFYRMP